ncbi:MAG: calcium-binding protein [Parvibaculum sp.]|nr:calcium-binding protein [Parvibaculum sp.]
MFGAGILQADLRVTNVESDIIIQIINPNDPLAADQIVVKGAFTDDTKKIESYEFADGSTLTAAQVKALASIVHGTESNDTFTGNSQNQTFYGYGGNDTITDIIGGNDVLYGGEGDDVIRTRDGADTVYAGAGNDTIRYGATDSKNSRYEGGDGDDLFEFQNYNSTYHSEATHVGGHGNDVFTAGYAADIYVYERGDGSDSIEDQSSAYYPQADKIVFGAGISISDLHFSNNGTDILIDITDPSNLEATDRITVEQAFVDSSYMIETYQFADGSSLTGAAAKQLALIKYGTSGDDVMTGTSQGDTYFGLQGNDTITDAAGGNDTYIFNRGDAHDVIRDFTTSSNGTDKIAFGTGITQGDLVVTHSGQHIVITISDAANPGVTDSITLQDAFAANTYSNNEIEVYEFADGSTLTASQMKALASVVRGSETADVLDGMSSENEILYGYGGNDTIADISGDSSIYGGTGNDDITFGYAENHTIHGDEGDDYLHASYIGADATSKLNTFVGGSGNDRIVSGSSKDTYVFNRGDGQDTIWDYNSFGSAGADKILFGAGIVQGDLRVTNSSGHIVVTIINPSNPSAMDSITLENAYINASLEIESLQFADGTAMSAAQLKALAVVIHGTSGNDVLSGSNQNEVFYGYEGNDTIDGQDGNDTIDGGEGNDTLTGSSGFNIIHGGLGNDTISNSVNGGEVYGEEGDDDITFSSMNGSYISNGNHLLDGGAGNDHIHMLNINEAMDRANTIVGGTGNDLLESKSSKDTYIFNRGDGQDIIKDQHGVGSGSGSDKIVFGAGIVQSDLRVTNSGGHIVIAINDPSNPAAADSITLDNAYNNVGCEIETLQFADGSVISAAQLKALAATIHGTSGDDSFFGTIQNEVFYGYEGNDNIDGSEGDDILHGGLGNDTLNGGNGVDVIFGAEGNDTITDLYGNGSMYGDDGNDNITFGYADSHTIHGGEGDDFLHSNYTGSNVTSKTNTFAGGAGNDRIESGSSQDIYLFNRGDGQDAISDVNSYSTTSGLDKIVFGAGIVQSDLSVANASGHIVITVNNPSNPGVTDSITLENAYTSNSWEIESFEFADGSVMSAAQIKTLAAVFHGTSADDSLVGSSLSEVFYGYEGNDSISASDGNDTLYGGAGNDTLLGSSGVDVIYGGAGNDTISDSSGDGTIYGEEGNDNVTFGYADSHTIYGGEGDDFLHSNYTGSNVTSKTNTFVGGAGNDRIESGSSQDTYLFNRGDGQDVIIDVNDFSTTAGADKIVFGTGILQSDLTVTRAGHHIVITVLDPNNPASTDSITLEYAYTYESYQIESFEFADGSTLTAAQMKALAATIHGTTGNDILAGTSDGEAIFGYEGNDSLAGAAGNDKLDGGVGADTLAGGAGNDEYLFALNGGIDVINNTTASTSDVDVLRLLSGISTNQLFFSQNVDDLVVDLLDSDDRITVSSAFTAADNQMDAIFLGNQVLYANQLNQLITALSAFTPDPGNGGEFNQQQRDEIATIVAASFQNAA